MARNYWKSSSRTLVLRNRSRSVVFETHFESLRKWSKSHLKVRFERRHLIWMVTLKSGKANDERHFEQRDPSFSKRLHSCCLFSENVRGNLSLAWFKLFSLYKQNNLCRAVKLSCYFEGSDRCRNSLKWVFGHSLCSHYCSGFKLILIFCSAWPHSRKVVFKRAIWLNTFYIICFQCLCTI